MINSRASFITKAAALSPAGLRTRLLRPSVLATGLFAAGDASQPKPHLLQGDGGQRTRRVVLTWRGARLLPGEGCLGRRSPQALGSRTLDVDDDGLVTEHIPSAPTAQLTALLDCALK